MLNYYKQEQPNGLLLAEKRLGYMDTLSTDDTAIVYPILAVCSMLVMGGILVMRKRKPK